MFIIILIVRVNEVAMTSSVQRKMAKGAMWMVLLTSTTRVLGLISMLILARLLTPADFGIVAMALSFVFLAELLSAFGFDVALIHNQNATESHYNTAWTFKVILGFVILLLMVALADPISRFYDQPDVFWVVCALAAGPLVVASENIGVVAFRKDLEFHKEFAFQISRKVIGFIVTVPLAIWMGNYWALVIGTLASHLAGTITSYLVHPFRPRFSLSESASLFGFSKWLLLNNVCGLLKERLSDFVIGRMAGPAALGVYNISYEFAHLPTTEIGAPINRALLPGFAKLSEPAAVQSAYMNAMGMLAIVAIPAAAGIMAVAQYFVPVVLGKKWVDGIPLMEILSISGAFLMFQASICSLLIAKGHPAVVARTNALFVALLIGFLSLLVTPFGSIGAAYAALATTSLTMPVYLHVLRKRVGVPIKAFVHSVIRPVLAAAGMVIVIYSIVPMYSIEMTSLHASMWLLVGVLSGVGSYAVFVLLIWIAIGRPYGPERMIVDIVRARLARMIRQNQY